MYCKKCGKQIPDDSMFCNFCGAGNGPVEQVKKETPKVETPKSKEKVTISQVAESHKVVCPKCGSANLEAEYKVLKRRTLETLICKDCWHQFYTSKVREENIRILEAQIKKWLLAEFLFSIASTCFIKGYEELGEEPTLIIVCWIISGVSALVGILAMIYAVIKEKEALEEVERASRRYRYVVDSGYTNEIEAKWEGISYHKTVQKQGNWTCKCGRINASYVGTCACGRKKSDIV